MDELMIELLAKEYSLINFIVFKGPDGTGAIRQINKQTLKQLNQKTGLTEKELNEIFEPVSNAVEYCTKEFWRVKNDFKRKNSIKD